MPKSPPDSNITLGLDALARACAPRGRVFVISGPSGVGKDTVLDTMMALPDCPSGLVRCITATTRSPRPGEVNGMSYHFLERSDFERRVQDNGFYEYVEYNGSLYGTPRAGLEQQRSGGVDVLLKIEVRGAAAVRSDLPEATLAFIIPPSIAELERRLRGRGDSAETAVRERLVIATSEMERAMEYDYVVVNDDPVRAARNLAAIITAERSRVPRPWSIA